MTVQISIIGLGQIGASLGLALAVQKELVKRVGSDLDKKAMNLAEKMGAVDKTVYNLPSAVRDADLVILALPTDQIRETLETIASELKPNAVVMDTAPVKGAIANWAKELLPEDRHYVGLTPVINPAYLHTHESGVEAAHADLFRGGLIVIVASMDASSEAVKLATDLARLLGATPLFADALEVDSLMAATHILPQMLAVALLNTTIDQPGWYEGRKLAGRAYAEVTGPLVQLGEPEALCDNALLAGENSVRVIDNVITALYALRNDIKNQDGKALKERMVRARKGRETWWSQRQAGNWAGEELASAVPPPKSSEVFGRLFGLSGRQKPKV